MAGRAWLHVFDDFLKGHPTTNAGLGAVPTMLDTNLFRVQNEHGHVLDPQGHRAYH